MSIMSNFSEYDPADVIEYNAVRANDDCDYANNRRLYAWRGFLDIFENDFETCGQTAYSVTINVDEKLHKSFRQLCLRA